jgi:hypothetical protein
MWIGIFRMQGSFGIKKSLLTLLVIQKHPKFRENPLEKSSISKIPPSQKGFKNDLKLDSISMKNTTNLNQSP